LEVPKYLIGGTFNCNVNPLDGLAVGLVRGVSRGFERMAIGAWEAVTFPLAGYDPLLCPEFISFDCCMGDWRYGNYCEMPCGVCCDPCHGAGSFMGVRPQPQQPAPQPAPMERPAPAFEQPLQSQAPPPPRTRAATPGNSGGRAPVTYPDDYLK